MWRVPGSKLVVEKLVRMVTNSCTKLGWLKHGEKPQKSWDKRDKLGQDFATIHGPSLVTLVCKSLGMGMNNIQPCTAWVIVIGRTTSVALYIITITIIVIVIIIIIIIIIVIIIIIIIKNGSTNACMA